jgi:hypothetical protein
MYLVFGARIAANIVKIIEFIENTSIAPPANHFLTLKDRHRVAMRKCQKNHERKNERDWKKTGMFWDKFLFH